VISSF